VVTLFGGRKAFHLLNATTGTVESTVDCCGGASSTVSTSSNNCASSHPHDCNCASNSSDVVRPTSVDERIPSQSSWESAASAQNDPDAFTIQCDRSMLEDHSEVKTRKFHCPGSNKGFVVDWGRYWDMMSTESVTVDDCSSSHSQN